MALEATHVSFGYRPGRPVLSDISLALEPGTITAIVGPNGAGKSTLLRLLLGILRPTSGAVSLDGHSIASVPHRRRACQVAYVPQRPAVAFAFTVREFVTLGRYAAGGRDDAGAVAAALGRVELTDRADDPFTILSVGQQQRAALARALVQLSLPREVSSSACPACGYDRSGLTAGGSCPECARSGVLASSVLLADEPVSAMDPRHTLQTVAIFRELTAVGAAVAVVLHDLSLALRSADRAAVLDGSGRLVAVGPAEPTLTPAVLDAVFQVRFRPVSMGNGPAALVPTLSEVH